MISCDTWIHIKWCSKCRYMIQRSNISNHVPPELKWHQMMFFLIFIYLLGNQKDPIFQWWTIFLILYDLWSPYFWVFIRLANQCKFRLEVWRKDRVVSQDWSDGSICWYANPSCRDLKIPWAGSFGSDHQTMGIQRMRHTHATHAYAMLYTHTHTHIYIRGQLWYMFDNFCVLRFILSVPQSLKETWETTLGSCISLYFIRTYSTHAVVGLLVQMKENPSIGHVCRRVNQASFFESCCFSL